MTVSSVLKNGFSIGIKNLFSLAGALLLYLLTIWMPYINIGTTIALYTLPSVMSKGKVISPFEIFDSKYRRNMGDFFLLLVFLSLGIFLGSLFFVLPGIILIYSWSLALLLLVDKGLNPMEALTESNARTWGHKFTIFMSYLIFGLIYFVVYGLIAYFSEQSIFEYLQSIIYEYVYGYNLYNDYDFVYNYDIDLSLGSTVLALFQLLLIFIYYPLKMGITAEIYRKLC